MTAVFTNFMRMASMRDDSRLGWAGPGGHNGSETILSNGNAMISPLSPLRCSICARLVT